MGFGGDVGLSLEQSGSLCSNTGLAAGKQSLVEIGAYTISSKSSWRFSQFAQGHQLRCMVQSWRNGTNFLPLQHRLFRRAVQLDPLDQTIKPQARRIAAAEFSRQSRVTRCEQRFAADGALTGWR